MVNVVDSYKLITVDIGGKEQTIKINTSEAWAVFDFEFEGKTYTVQEGDIIRFANENSEIKQGNVLKVKGKKEKTKIQFVPTGSEHEETWSVLSIKEGSLKVLSAENEDEEEDDTEDNE